MELDTLDENGNYNDGHIATLLESKATTLEEGSIAVFALLLLDSGACNSFISLQLVEELELPLRELRHAFTMRSASGTHITGKLCTCEIVFQRLMLAHGFSCCSYVTSVDTWFAFSTSLYKRSSQFLRCRTKRQTTTTQAHCLIAKRCSFGAFCRHVFAKKQTRKRQRLKLKT